MNIELIGWIGSILFCFCGAPQAWKSYKDGHSRGISHGFLWMWGLGEVLTLIYVILSLRLSLPLITNYVVNLIFITIIFKYKYWERGDYVSFN